MSEDLHYCAFEASIHSSICPETVNGWVWYCDAHDTHGNADSKEEAELIAQAHEDHWVAVESADDEWEEQMADDVCYIFVFMRKQEEPA